MAFKVAAMLFIGYADAATSMSESIEGGGSSCTSDFVDHFDKALLAKAKTESQSLAFELEHTRKEEVALTSNLYRTNSVKNSAKRSHYDFLLAEFF